MEIKVRMYNINYGHNKELMKKCRVLYEYAQYVERVRKYARVMEMPEAVEKAVEECISEGILTDFLKKNRSEVVRMSIFEYDEEEVKKMWQEEAYEEGLEEGREEGREAGIVDSLAAMITILKKAGYNKDKIIDILGEEFPELNEELILNKF